VTSPQVEPDPLTPDWADFIDGLPLAAWLVQLSDGRVVAVNDAALALMAVPRSALLGQPGDSLLPTPEDLAYWDELATGAAQPLRSDTSLCTADGRTLYVTRSIRPWPATAPTHALVTLNDRSAEQRAEAALEERVAELQATLEATADGILVTDLTGRIRAFNRRFAQIWTLPENLLTERNDAAVFEWMRRSVVDLEAYDRRLALTQHATLLTSTERLELHSGQVLERVTRPLWSRGRPLGRVDSFRDLTERLAADQRIEELSMTDALTGLANRRQMAERVAASAASARREGQSFALLVVDLDRFRQINNSLGHDVGDRVLLDVAQRIQGCLRQQDLLARMGGDQFGVLVHGADAAAAEATSRRVLNVIAQPCSVDGAQFTITCSIGVALCPSHGWAVDDLVRHAENAMRAVKGAGRANFRLHQSRGEGDRRAHMKLDHAMRQALVSGRFKLHYQPQVNLADGRIVGAEALLRWRDPELGEVSPTRFIPVAEESGFIVAIGDWVLSQAVRQATLWHQRGHALPLAVNVSALQFSQSHFVDRVAHVLAVSGLPPQLLELELTETILLHDAEDALQRLGALAGLGVRMSIDDFGTGYSSLAYLKRFPIGKLKIDRSFVNGLPEDESDAGIVRAILQMARALGMKVIAEGVETEAQRQFLHEAGCDEFQGFLFAPALDCLSFEARLAGAPSSPMPASRGPRMRLVQG
jgi:diguanylate cyclase (GGDEF)-like protein